MNDKEDNNIVSGPVVLYQTKSLTIVSIFGVKLSLELNPVESGLLKALCPHGAAKTTNAIEQTAMRILSEGMRSEARRRRIDSGKVFSVALSEAVKHKKQRTNEIGT